MKNGPDKSWIEKSIKKSLEALGSSAQKVLNQQETFTELIAFSKKRAEKNREFLKDVYGKIGVLFRLLNCYARGTYREVELSSVLILVASLLYFINPMDMIPDFLVGGFTDDAMVFGWILKTFSDEIERFETWESQQIK